MFSIGMEGQLAVYPYVFSHANCYDDGRSLTILHGLPLRSSSYHPNRATVYWLPVTRQWRPHFSPLPEHVLVAEP